VQLKQISGRLNLMLGEKVGVWIFPQSRRAETDSGEQIFLAGVRSGSKMGGFTTRQKKNFTRGGGGNLLRRIVERPGGGGTPDDGSWGIKLHGRVGFRKGLGGGFSTARDEGVGVPNC